MELVFRITIAAAMRGMRETHVIFPVSGYCCMSYGLYDDSRCLVASDNGFLYIVHKKLIAQFKCAISS